MVDVDHRHGVRAPSPAPANTTDNPGDVTLSITPGRVDDDVVVVLPETGSASGPAAALAALEASSALEPLDQGRLLDDLVQRWAATYEPRTAAGRRRHLEDWVAYCAEHDVDPLRVTPDLVHAYQRELEATDYAYVVVRARLGDVRGFYRFLVEEQVRFDDPSLGTTRRPPASLAAALAVAGQDRTVEQLAVGFLLTFQRHTRRAYEQGLRALFTYCQEVGVDPLAVQRPHVDHYRTVLDARYAPSTVNHRITVARAFYRYCVDEGALERSPVRGFKPHRLPNVSPSLGLEREEVRALLRAAEQRGPQAHALLTLLAMNGLRISEALGADVDDLGAERGHRVLRVQRKGYWGSKQAVPLAPRTAQLLDAWLQVRPIASPLEHDSHRGPIFLNARGARMSRQSAWNDLRTLAKHAVPHKANTVRVHDFRNAFVTMALDAGVSPRDVQDSAGHASADTTRRYDTGRGALDRHATYRLAAYLSSSDD